MKRFVFAIMMILCGMFYAVKDGSAIETATIPTPVITNIVRDNGADPRQAIVVWNNLPAACHATVFYTDCDAGTAVVDNIKSNQVAVRNCGDFISIWVYFTEDTRRADGNWYNSLGSLYMLDNVNRVVLDENGDPVCFGSDCGDDDNDNEAEFDYLMSNPEGMFCITIQGSNYILHGPAPLFYYGWKIYIPGHTNPEQISSGNQSTISVNLGNLDPENIVSIYGIENGDQDNDSRSHEIILTERIKIDVDSANYNPDCEMEWGPVTFSYSNNKLYGPYPRMFEYLMVYCRYNNGARVDYPLTDGALLNISGLYDGDMIDIYIVELGNQDGDPIPHQEYYLYQLQVTNGIEPPDSSTTTTTIPNCGDDDEGGGDDGCCGCFIATAAYGSKQAEQVITLSQFRDKYLLTNPVGRLLVRLYYMLSPPAADFISGHDWMRAGSRVLLSPLYLAVKTFNKFSFCAGILALIALLLYGRAVAYRQRG